MGSGIETIAHLRENGRIVRHVLRVRGRRRRSCACTARGHVVQQGDDGFAERLAAFDISDEQRRAVRSVIDVEVTRVADSCGFVVPRMTYEGERDQLYRYADNRLRKEGPDAVRAYVSANNAESIDGLDGLDSLVDDAASRRRTAASSRPARRRPSCGRRRRRPTAARRAGPARPSDAW